MPADGRIPLRIVTGAVEPQPGEALVVTGAHSPSRAPALTRHAGAAAAAQRGACPCCRRPSDVATALRRLVIDRARGEVEFSGVLLSIEPADRDLVIDELAEEPLVAARYAIRSE